MRKASMSDFGKKTWWWPHAIRSVALVYLPYMNGWFLWYMYVDEGKSFFSLDPMGIELSFNESKASKLETSPNQELAMLYWLNLWLWGRINKSQPPQTTAHDQNKNCSQSVYNTKEAKWWSTWFPLLNKLPYFLEVCIHTQKAQGCPEKTSKINRPIGPHDCILDEHDQLLPLEALLLDLSHCLTQLQRRSAAVRLQRGLWKWGGNQREATRGGFPGEREVWLHYYQWKNGKTKIIYDGVENEYWIFVWKWDSELIFWRFFFCERTCVEFKYVCILSEEVCRNIFSDEHGIQNLDEFSYFPSE